ncbi:MAG: hypothetical protein AB7Q42_22250, partial [Acidimicrobiia bacterium]
PAGPTLLAASLAVLSILLGWRGTDTAAHFFRVGLVKRDGFHVWNNYWFGGHHTPGYSLLFPALGAVIGIWIVAVVSAASSALTLDLVLRRATGGPRRWASIWFAAGTVTNIAIGRLPFALGMAVALGALLAAVHGRIMVAGLLSVLCAAASPVTGAFLALIWAAWALAEIGRARRAMVALVACALGPVLALSAIYPQGGSFPFRWTALVWSVVVAGVVVVLVEQRVVRIAAVLYGMASVVAFLVPTPLGGNLTRFGMYAAGPVLLALVPLRRLVFVVLVPALLWWQWSPAFDAMFQSGRDESTRQEYYRPLLQFLESVDAEDARVEIVPTQRHWETAYVAFEFPIARGWERQLDIRFQPMFYEPDLSAGDYRAWLMEAGVQYVALADAPLDRSGLEEARLLEEDLWYLRPAWRSDHWRVWEVTNSTGLIDGPAEVVDIDADSVWIDVRAAGDVKLRVRPSAYWVSDPPLCIEPTTDDWIELRDAQPGRIRVFIDESDLVSTEDPCQPADP